MAAVTEGATDDSRVAEALRAYSFMKTFKGTYADYLDTEEQMVDTLLTIEEAVCDKADRRAKIAERKASGTPLATSRG